MSAENPYVNKVQTADGIVLMDISSDTVTPSDVLNGVTFHDRSGAPQQGSVITHNVYDGLDSSSASDALSAKQGKILANKHMVNSKVLIDSSAKTVRSLYIPDSTNAIIIGMTNNFNATFVAHVLTYNDHTTYYEDFHKGADVTLSKEHTNKFIITTGTARSYKLLIFSSDDLTNVNFYPNS